MARPATREKAIEAMQREIRWKKQQIGRMAPQQRWEMLGELSQDELRLKKLAEDL